MGREDDGDGQLETDRTQWLYDYCGRLQRGNLGSNETLCGGDGIGLVWRFGVCYGFINKLMIIDNLAVI